MGRGTLVREIFAIQREVGTFVEVVRARLPGHDGTCPPPGPTDIGRFSKAPARARRLRSRRAAPLTEAPGSLDSGARPGRVSTGTLRTHGSRQTAARRPSTPFRERGCHDVSVASLRPASGPAISSSLGRITLTAAVTLAYAVIFAPIVVVIVISFFNQEIVTFPPKGLTLHWYVNAWGQRDFARGFVTSFEIALAATMIGVPVGTAASLTLIRGRLPAKGVMNTFLLAPLAVPGIVAGSALYMFYLRAENWFDMDIKATFGGLVAANVLLTIPWTVRLTSASLATLDRSAEEAAANLGARPVTVFRRITLPMLRPGVVAAALFSFVASFENLELNILLVGPGRTTLPVAMLNYLEFRMDPTLAAVATAQIVMVTCLMLLTDRFVKLSRVV